MGSTGEIAAADGGLSRDRTPTFQDNVMGDLF